MMRLDHPIQILDSTLREGEQAAGVRFSLEQKLTLAKELDAFGVDFIEAGHPVVSEAIRQAVVEIQKLGLRAHVIAHARARREDVETVARCGVPWVGIFCGINRYTLECKLHMSKAQAIEQILDAIRYAKSLGLSVRYSCEDVSRTDLEEVVHLYRQAIAAGADRLTVVDTVGILTPRRAYEIVSRFKREFTVPIHVHCHNDFGMAVANALSAVEAGATVIDVTINGLGERSGIPPLAEVCAALKVLYNIPNPWRLERLQKLSRLVSRYTGIPLGQHRPIVGAYAFSHKAGLHTVAVQRDPASYEALDPTSVGAKRKIIVDEFIGKSALRNHLKQSGILLDESTLESILLNLKNGKRPLKTKQARQKVKVS
ncbi:MAG: homocitrate synthase [Candidatus Omnitrophica bacterium]|nr:homocitrate synthase [Candidatus Omnitrophota bacterium]